MTWYVDTRRYKIMRWLKCKLGRHVRRYEKMWPGGHTCSYIKVTCWHCNANLPQ